MNMTKIAKLAGCSLATVSKAFRNSSEISEETKNKIYQIAKENNCFNKFYTPIYKKKVFAVVCSELTNSIYGDIVDALNIKIAAKGDTLLISNSNFVASDLDKLLEYFANFHRVDGLIIIDGSSSTIDRESEEFHQFPLVFIRSGLARTQPFFDCVERDRSFGIHQAVAHFKAMGHTKIAYIGEYLTARSQTAFLDSMKNHGLETREEWLVCSSKRKAEAGFDAMDRLLSLPDRPTAIFAAYDAIAFGAMSRIHRAGLRVPNDFSIISSDNIPLSQFASPPLSTVSVPVDEIANATLNLLYNRLENKDAPYQKISIQSSLIIRDSVMKIDKK